MKCRPVYSEMHRGAICSQCLRFIGPVPDGVCGSA